MFILTISHFHFLLAIRVFCLLAHTCARTRARAHTHTARVQRERKSLLLYIIQKDIRDSFNVVQNYHDHIYYSLLIFIKSFFNTGLYITSLL